MIPKAIFNRAPLTLCDFAPLPLGAISPQGWLRQQLNVARDGLTGTLHTFWEDVGANSGWLGGEGEAWERGPYYMDGYLPLAYLLEDEGMKAHAGRFIQWTLNSQKTDGSFGPANDDWWPRMVMLKVMMQYYTATSEPRVLEFMWNYFMFQLRTIAGKPLHTWGSARGAENTQAVLWLYNITGQKKLLELARLIVSQTLDWRGFYNTFPYNRPFVRYIPWAQLREGMVREEAEGRDKSGNMGYYTTQYHLTHIVNNAMGLKAPGIHGQLTHSDKDVTGFSVGYEKLMRYHGVATGMFNGDEHLSGADPTQGTECCAVVELMYTLESLLAVDAKPEYGDLLEKLAFNALPATLTPDMKGHQYLQQVNQVKVSQEKRNWYNNNDDSTLYGLEPNFGCCTANMHQGFPKFASSLWMATCDEGLAAISYAPCVVRARVAGVPAKVTVITQYPYEEHVTIRLSLQKEATFSMQFRIPSWAEGAYLTLGEERHDGKPGTFLKINRHWIGGDEMHLTLPMQVRTGAWYHQTVAVERGPLLYALQIGEAFKKVKDHPIAPDWQVTPTTPWNYALLPQEEMTVQFSAEKVGPFGPYHAPVTITAKGARLPQWEMVSGNAGQPPISPLVTQEDICQITLIPYGCTNLRIAQFPVARVPVSDSHE